jgi:hypothetical protein
MTMSKEMVLVFLDAKGVIYMNYAPRGNTFNAEYVMKFLAWFLVIFGRRGP